MTTRRLAALACLLTCSLACAQEKGYWRAASKTAASTTGDLAFRETKVTINFTSFTIAQLLTVSPAQANAVFSELPASAPGSGNLYALDIAGSQQFLHRNTLCGADDTRYMLTFVSGKTLSVAFFSGAAMPKLTPEAIASTTNLCGTYTYVR